MRKDDTTREILADLFNHENPFGPTNASAIVDQDFVLSHPPEIVSDVLKSTFWTDCEAYSEFLRDPSLIVGRRGAGKTAFLSSTRLDSAKHIVIDLPEARTFSRVLTSVEQLTQSGHVLVDLVAELWHAVLWSNVVARVGAIGDDVGPGRVCSQFIRAIGVTEPKDSNRVMQRFLSLVQDLAPGGVARLSEEFDSARPAGAPSFHEAKSAAVSFLHLKDIHVTILLDSLDDLRLDAADMKHAMAGLLKCQGEFTRPGMPCRLRVCLPAEMYYELKRVSVNQNKDFGRQLLIRWKARELFQIAARRYLIFLELNDPGSFSELRGVKLAEREGLRRFWNKVLPRSINNFEGAEEDSLAYIARHTQLLPRHLLMLMNSIARKSRSYGTTHFSQEGVRSGIEEVEGTLCDEIFGAFRLNYPAAEEACTKCIRYLPRVFAYGELHHVFNLYGQGLPGIAEFAEFRDMLARVGVIGKVVARGERYAFGEFEYYLPYPLSLRSDDELCVHPMFSRVFNARRTREGEVLPFVFARGAEVET